jgi:hypothetical protein
MRGANYFGDDRTPAEDSNQPSSKRIHHPLHRGMAAVLHLYPLLLLPAAIGPVAMLAEKILKALRMRDRLKAANYLQPLVNAVQRPRSAPECRLRQSHPQARK